MGGCLYRITGRSGPIEPPVSDTINGFLMLSSCMGFPQLSRRMLMTQTTRRSFLKRSAATAGAALATPYLFSSAQPLRAEAANDRLRIGCIGVGSMGKGDARDFSHLCDIAAICDVDSDYGLAQAMNVGEIARYKPDQYKDYRKILERKDIDVVSIVTVDHWHVKIAIEALQAGKHVFCQKPLTLTVEEGKRIRDAVKKYPKQVFQVGTQQRAQRDEFLLAALMVRKGVLGDITKMTADIGNNPVSGPLAKEAAPESLDWDFWQGQCKPVDYIKRRCHYEYRWWYEYSGGKYTDWGAHHIDFAHWALGEVGEGMGPTSVKPIMIKNTVEFKDGYPTADDCYNTPEHFEVSCKFPSGIELLVVSRSQDGNGILIEGTKGKIHVNRGRIAGKAIEEKWHEGVVTEEDFVAMYNGKPFERNHKKNFINCIREGGTPVSDVISHVQSMNTCHLCAIASRLNREIKFDPKTETIQGDEQASAFLSSPQRKGFEIPVV